MAALELSSSVFAILSGLIEERIGLHYGLQDRELLQEKISARALEAGFDSLLDYYYYLRYDLGGEAELAELAETLIVGETYFFREWQSIEVLVDTFIEPWVSAGRRPRIWCAACATGEEPLSLAMLLDARGLLERTELLATDLSARSLARAQAGRFRPRALRRVPDERLAGRYIRGDDGHYRVPERLIAAIRWQRYNLISDSGPGEPGAFDAILCRNVLIYFSDDTVRKVLDRFRIMLNDQGVLLVGLSESLLRYGSAFAGEEHGGAFLYRKADAR